MKFALIYCVDLYFLQISVKSILTRNSETMKQGGPIALYTEDAAVGFDNVKIRPL